MEKCWTCRRRRHKCDGARPHCTKCLASDLECLGYGKTKPLSWVNGIASRGRWKNCASFHDADPSPLANLKYSRSGTFMPAFAPQPKPSPGNSSTPSDTQLSQGIGPLVVCPPLTDPMYQDLGVEQRFFIDYFHRRLCPSLIIRDHAQNPYREIIPRAGSSMAITHAIIALSACHYSHGVAGVPLFPQSHPRQRSDLPNSVLARNYIRLQNIALRSLAEELKNPDSCTYVDAFLTSFLLALLDIVESGANTWSFHLEGAKKLLNTKLCTGPPGSTSILQRVANELAVFDTITSTLVRPGILQTSPDLLFGLDEMNKARGLTFIGCPVVIITALQFTTRQRWARYCPDDASWPMRPDPLALQDNLRQIRDFDVRTWANLATEASDDKSPGLHDLLVHNANIWKLAVDIYTARVYSGLTGDPTTTIPSVDDIIAEFALLEPHDTGEKCLIWPTFIAGAECTRADQRDWAMSTMGRIWQMTFSANCQNASRVLTGLWEKQDLFRESHGTEDLDGWDWVMEISLQDDQWSFY